MKFIRRHIIPLLFAITSYAILLLHADYLFALQDNSIFIGGRTFMRETLMYPTGIWSWMGCWLTQFFYLPWLGAAVMVALWVLTYYLLIWATGLKNWRRIFAVVPQALMLYTLLCLGYWMFYGKTPGIAFVPTLVLLAAATLTCAIMKAPHLFAVLGGERLSGKLRREDIKFPPIKGKAGRGLFSYMLLIPLYIVLCPSLTLKSVTLPDSRLKSELRMYRAIDECRWNDVLKDFHTTDRPTNLMVLYKNIALMHTNRLQDMFKEGNCGYWPKPTVKAFSSDTLQLHISQLAAPMVYYQYGQLNYAYRWAIENSVEYGQSVRNVKTLVRCAIMNQEFDVAYKYITMLKTTLFHKEWAKQQEAMLSSSTALLQSAEFQNIAPLMNDEGNLLDADDGLCEKWILDHFADLIQATSPKLEEVIITTSLWTKDEYAFAFHFYNYINRHPNEPIPLLYQEAAILLCNNESSPLSLNQFPFDNIISDKYNRFVQDYNQLATQRLSDEEMAKRLKPLYGDTYWWYYYFYTDFQIY
jgi:hypothetical protein